MRRISMDKPMKQIDFEYGGTDATWRNGRLAAWTGVVIAVVALATMLAAQSRRAHASAPGTVIAWGCGTGQEVAAS
jgi:hypothetical protein